MSEKSFATLTTTHFTLKEGTKTVWVQTETQTEEISREHYNNIVEASPFFRRLGGSETVTKGYTSRGYMPVEIVSKSPDRTQKTVRKFDIR